MLNGPQQLVSLLFTVDFRRPFCPLWPFVADFVVEMLALGLHEPLKLGERICLLCLSVTSVTFSREFSARPLNSALDR